LIGLSKFVPSRIVLQDPLALSIVHQTEPRRQTRPWKHKGSFIRLPIPAKQSATPANGEAAFIGLVFKPPCERPQTDLR
jgi:hypothetical protein